MRCLSSPIRAMGRPVCYARASLFDRATPVVAPSLASTEEGVAVSYPYPPTASTLSGPQRVRDHASPRYYRRDNIPVAWVQPWGVAPPSNGEPLTAFAGARPLPA